jgi:hypothetical protein
MILLFLILLVCASFFIMNCQLDDIVTLDSLLCALFFYRESFCLLIFVVPENFLFLIEYHKEFDIEQNQSSH